MWLNSKSKNKKINDNKKHPWWNLMRKNGVEKILSESMSGTTTNGDDLILGVIGQVCRFEN